MSLKVPQSATEMVQSWSPRPLNRGEHFELDHYEIFFANKKAMVQLHLLVKNNETIIRKFDGNSDFVYSEVLKGLPDNRLEDFRTDWVNAKLDYVTSQDLTLLGQAIARQSRDKLKIPTKKNKADLMVGNKRVEIKIDKTKKEIVDLGFFNYQNPNQILADKIRSSTKDISEISEKVGLHISMVSKQMKGQREITRDHAFAYAKFFGCDPADILFAAPQIPIWSTVDFLKFKDHDMPFNPGECVTVTDKREYVVCPRDIYRPDIKAVKVNSPGSYLDGMVLFYYATSDVKQDCLGRLSIVGDEDDTDDALMKELRFGEKQRYYIGILEQYKGKTKLLNPDPYAKESLPKDQGDIIINNITPSFASPIVGIVNPAQIKKDKHSSKLFKSNDEILRTTRMTELKMVEQMKIKELTLQKQAHELEHKLKKEIEHQIKQHERQLIEFEKKLKEQDKKNLYSGIGSLFYPNQKSGGLLDIKDFKDKKKQA
ncbi:helix-turn-helix domain-containing protein [Pelagibacteraceae bacterium]|nr:helix-turn-helix domain-containing protein [Pelagibacteraceae bacterium]